MHKRGHAAEALLAAVIAACGTAPAWAAAPDKKHTFDIPALPLSQAIIVFDRQAGLLGGVVSDTDEEASVPVCPIRGEYTAEEALRRLLKCTGFEFERISTDTISVYKKSSPGNASKQTTAENPLPTSLLYQEHGGLDDWGGPGDIVLVTAVRLADSSTEVKEVNVVSRQKIESSGATTVPELLAVVTQIPFMKSPDARQSGEQYADLRGLGPGSTLVLLNGRRLPATATSSDNSGVDMNMIPLSAVKRIEIVLDSPSVVTGTDAPGGVVNIVLKNDVAKPIAEIWYGGASGGAQERRASLSFGTAGNVFRGSATLDVLDRNKLLGSERVLTRDQDYRRYGSSDSRTTQAAPGNVMSLTSQNLPGLNSPVAGVPVGSSGTLTPADFVVTSGQANENRTSSFQYRSIIPDSARASLVASGELSLSTNVDVFAEFLGVDRTTATETGPPAITGVVSAANPFNPFGGPSGVPVMVSTVLQSMPSQTDETDTTFLHAVSGIRSTWAQWHSEASVSWSSERTKLSLENRVDSLRLAQALSASDRDHALNVFQDGPAGSTALLDSLIASPTVRDYRMDTLVVSTRAQGPILSIPGGETLLTAGTEWRKENFSTDSLPNVPQRTVSSAFAEMRVPVLSPRMAISAAQELSLSLGIRVDDYHGEFDTQFTPQYGLLWRPINDLKIRAAYSYSYSVPALYYMYTGLVRSSFPVQDPLRKNALTTVAFGYAGNSSLRVAPAHSWTAGFEFTPSEIANLRLSTGYWRTAIDDYIAQITIPFFLAHEDMFPGRAVRAAPSAQDIAAGIPGTLLSIDISPGNFGQLRASGFDFGASYAFNTNIGRFTSNLSATLYRNYSAASVAGFAPQERVGIASEYGTVPKWRAMASVEWARGPVNLFTAARFVSQYDDALVGVRTGSAIPAQMYVDAQISVLFSEWTSASSVLEGVKLSAGATNLFNAAPHFAQVGYAFGYDYSQGDLRQRIWYARLTKQF